MTQSLGGCWKFTGNIKRLCFNYLFFHQKNPQLFDANPEISCINILIIEDQDTSVGI